MSNLHANLILALDAPGIGGVDRGYGQGGSHAAALLQAAGSMWKGKGLAGVAGADRCNTPATAATGNPRFKQSAAAERNTP